MARTISGFGHSDHSPIYRESDLMVPLKYAEKRGNRSVETVVWANIVHYLGPGWGKCIS